MTEGMGQERCISERVACGEVFVTGMVESWRLKSGVRAFEMWQRLASV